MTRQHPVLVDRARLAREKFSGVGVELGVAAGHYSAEISKSAARLYSIDRWSDHHGIEEYHRALRQLERRGNVTVMRCAFEEALGCFPERSLDFVYIDGYAHTGQEGGRTLEQWWPKLKHGGTFAGHDYHPRWPLTMDAVNDFAARQSLDVWITSEKPSADLTTGFPSWWMNKP